MTAGVRPAQLSRRALAYVIDGGVVAVLVGIMVIVWAGVLASTRSVGAILITNLVCGVVLLAWLWCTPRCRAVRGRSGCA